MSAARCGSAVSGWVAGVPPEALRAAFVECSAHSETRPSLHKLQARFLRSHVRMA